MKVTKFIALFLVVMLSASSSFAFIVSAPAVEAQLAALNTKTSIYHTQDQMKWVEQINKTIEIIKKGEQQIKEIQNQIAQGKEQFEFWKQHAGDWQAIAAKVRTEATDTALQSGTFCSTDTMTAGDLLSKNSTVSAIASAVTETKKLISGLNGKMTPADLRNAITQIVGKIPDSESAGISTFAQTQIEDDIAFIAKTNKAITQLQSEKARIRQDRDGKITSNRFTEAEKTQYEMADNDLNAQIQSLQLQSLLRIAQQQIVSNSFKVKNQNEVEARRNHEQLLRQATQSFMGN